MSAGSPASPRHGLVAIVAAAMIFGITYGLSAPLIALELSNRGHGEFVIGLNAAMQALGILTVAAFLPRLITRWGMQGVLLGALALTGLVLALFPLAGLLWLWLWFPLRYLLGIGSECVMVTTESWVGQAGEEGSRTTTMSIYTAAVAAGMAIGPLLLGHIGSGDAMPFLAGAAFAALACLVLVVGRLRGSRLEVAGMADVEHAPPRLSAVLRLAPLALAATALNAALETAGLTFLPLYAMDMGWSERGATGLVSTLLVGAIVLQLPIGWLGDRFDRRRLIVLLSVLSMLGALLWPAAIGVPWLGHALLFAWGGMFVGIYTLAATLVGSRYSGQQLVQVYAGMSVAFGVGALLGPPLAGAAMHATRHGLPLFAAAACAAFGLFAWRSRALA